MRMPLSKRKAPGTTRWVSLREWKKFRRLLDKSGLLCTIMAKVVSCVPRGDFAAALTFLVRGRGILGSPTSA